MSDLMKASQARRLLETCRGEKTPVEISESIDRARRCRDLENIADLVMEAVNYTGIKVLTYPVRMEDVGWLCEELELLGYSVWCNSSGYAVRTLWIYLTENTSL